MLEQLGLFSSGGEVPLWLRKDLDLSYEEALRRWPTSDTARIENSNQLIVFRLGKVYENKEEKAFRLYIQQLLPKIDLTNLLLRVN